MKEHVMKKGRYSENQIPHALNQAETGALLSEVPRRMEISKQIFCYWKRVYVRRSVNEQRLV